MGLFSNSKVAVLESKMESYERYFEKLDESIEKLSEISMGIKEVLIKHEGKLEERVLTEETLSYRLDLIKRESHEEHLELKAKVEGIEKKIEDLMKWRWTAAGAVLIIGLFIGHAIPGARSVPASVLQRILK